jgi:hypothetical protein
MVCKVAISASMSIKRIKNERLGVFVRSIKVRSRGRTVLKQDLPKKLCPVCQRPFAWRKKWERCWEEVIYCSQRCRREAKVS